MTTSMLERSAAPFDYEPARTNSAPTPIHVLRRSEIERQHYEDLLSLPTRELRDRAAQEIRSELDLPLEAQRQAVHARLAAWLELDAEDARILARTWDEAAAELPADDARRRFEAECDAILHGFRFRDFTQLVEFIPWLRSQFGLTLLSQTARTAA